jgi:ligand-binding sensor domain-containing protein
MIHLKTSGTHHAANRPDGLFAACWLCVDKAATVVSLVALFLLPGFVASGQNRSFRSYSLEEGLPQSQVWALCQDRNGFLWLGTQGGGLCCFDGAGFDIYTRTDGLPSNFIQAITQTSDLSVWVGTNRGLAWFDGKTFHTIDSMSTPVNALFQLSKNSLLVGTDVGLKLLDLNTYKLEPVAGLERTSIQAIYQGVSHLWFASGDGVWRARYNSLQNLEQFEKNLYFTSITQDRYHRVWASTLGRGLFILNGASGTKEHELDAPLLSAGLCLYGPVDNKVWLGTQDKGLALIDANTLETQQISERNGLPHNHVRSLLADRNGTMWIGTSGGGFAREQHQSFRHFNQKNGLLGNRIYALHEDASGRLWAAVSNRGIQLRDSAGFQTTGFDTIFQRTKCQAILTDSLGSLWVGTEGRGLVLIDSSGSRVFTQSDALFTNYVKRLVLDDRGSVWVASGGITRFSRNAKDSLLIEKFGIDRGLPNLAVSTIALGPDGNLWFATRDGKVGLIDGQKKVRVWDAETQLPRVQIRSLCFDRFKRLLLGTKGQGVWMAESPDSDPVFSRIGTAESGVPENVYLLVCDPEGRVWAGSETGVSALFFDEKKQLSGVQHFGKNEGFVGIETCEDAALVDRNGQLWFGTMNGLMQYTPGVEQEKSQAPPVHFEKISLFYKDLKETSFAAWSTPEGGIRDGMELPFKQNHLSFQFRAVDLSYPGEIEYRWMLEGAEENWSPAVPLQSVSYANLSPGAYTFLVQARTGSSAWSDPISASFLIRKPYWQESWFILSVVLGSLLLVGLIVWQYIHRIKQRAARQRAELELENQVLQLEQKALQLQMNPHFIFNALTSIQSLITEKSFATARQQINGFARLMRDILNNSRRRTISLAEEISTLRKYLEVERFCHQEKFDFQILCSEDIPQEELELPPMLLQPFVENAVVHGVSHLQYPGHISIEFRLEGEVLVCTIRDNGVGREQAARLREEKKPGHQSVSMEVTRQRLEALRADARYTPVEFRDVLNDAGALAGTEVVVRIKTYFDF